MILPSIGAAQPPHGEFDVAAGQLAPALYPAHIGRLGIAAEEIARRGPRLVARQCEDLAQIAVIRPTAGCHPVCQIARTKGHVATPKPMTGISWRSWFAAWLMSWSMSWRCPGCAPSPRDRMTPSRREFSAAIPCRPCLLFRPPPFPPGSWNGLRASD